MQNQLKFNLDSQLAASNVAVRYHRPNPIVVERAGGLVNVPHTASQQVISDAASVRSSIADDRMALAVRLAKRDLQKQREGRPRTPSPKSVKNRTSKGGVKMVYTKEAKERAERLQQKRAGRDPLKVREQGWNSGTSVSRTQTPPRDKQLRLNLPATTNSPPTRDTDHYPRSAPLDDPGQEILRLQKEMEGYLQQIQVVEQRAMTDIGGEGSHTIKSRKKDGYLEDEEDPARRALRQDEQAARSARQVYNLRQQVRALQDQVNRQGGGKIKHTQKSQVMLRLAAAHRGAVRAIQGFVNQQLPQHDIDQGLPTGYQELALLIRQLAGLSTQIRTNQDTSDVHSQLINMLDRVDELNKAWQDDKELKRVESEERRRKSPVSQQTVQSAPPSRGRQPVKKMGKENKPKGLLKKQFKKGPVNYQNKPKPRKLTPERQNVLQAGIQALIRENLRQEERQGEKWTVPLDDSGVTEQANTSLILPKGLQYKREKAQRSVALAVPDTHFTDATFSSSLKAKHIAEPEQPSKEPWKPGGSSHRSPGRSRDRSRSCDLSRSGVRGQSMERSGSKSPRPTFRDCVVQDMDTELMQELFPEGVDGMGSRGRSTSPGSRSQRRRSPSPPRSPGARSRLAAYTLKKKLGRIQRNAEDASMVQERNREISEAQMRQLLAGRNTQHGGIPGDMLTDMLVNDLAYDTAQELQALEDNLAVHDEAVTMHQNPTLENIYQRLEQMELEHLDIRRRWGTLQFEEQTSSTVTKSRNIERPSGPIALEISRKDFSKSSMVPDSRSYDKEEDAPIIFTKSVPVQHYKQHTMLGDTEDELIADHPLGLPHRSGKIRLKLPETSVREIQSNLEKYERHLKKTSHQTHGRFDPWKLVEEISDQVLSECLKEIEKELEDVEENIVHQVCKSEFALPEKQVLATVNSSRNFTSREPVSSIENFKTSQEYYDENLRSSQRETEERPVSALRESVDKSLQQSSIDTGRSKENGASSKKEVTFDDREMSYSREASYERESSYEREVSYERELSSDKEGSFQHGAIYDAAELDAVLDDRQPSGSMYQDVIENDDDEEDEISEVSPIDSEDLEYSTDET